MQIKPIPPGQAIPLEPEEMHAIMLGSQLIAAAGRMKVKAPEMIDAINKRGPVLEDPPFPQVRLFGTYGPVLQPPQGFEPPRICRGCGVVYYPLAGTTTGGVEPPLVAEPSEVSG